jgi:hypothetical protein
MLGVGLLVTGAKLEGRRAGERFGGEKIEI